MPQATKYAKHIPASIPTVRRLPSYLQVAHRHKEAGEDVISGKTIAEELELDAIQVRKDLAVTGINGKPRVGYAVNSLILALESFLGWDKQVKAIIVGVGNLGSALMGYTELKYHGLTFVAAFDIAPDKVGKDNIEVFLMEDMDRIVSSRGALMAILTVPADVAQTTCDTLVKSGIQQIWNFTNVRLLVPDNVIVLQEDLSSGYAVLTVIRNMSKQ